MKNSISSLFLLFFLCICSGAIAQYNPHPKEYTENFRGQYQFSPKTRWMNDINGIGFQVANK